MTKRELLRKHYSEKQEPRKFGRFNASELYRVLTGELNDKNFYEVEQPSDETLENFFRGETGEEAVGKLLSLMDNPPETQMKKEIKERGFVISCKIDFLNENGIAEVKCPRELPDEIKKWYKPQLEAYYRAFQVPVSLWCYDPKTIELRVFKYMPSDELWGTILDKCQYLHEMLSLTKEPEK